MKLSSFRAFSLVAAVAVTVIYGCIFIVALADLISGGISNEGIAGISLLSMVPSFPVSWIVLDIADAVRPDGLVFFDNGLANVALMIVIQWLVSILQWCLIVPLIAYRTASWIRKHKPI